jgi:hypothetical protein
MIDPPTAWVVVMQRPHRHARPFRELVRRVPVSARLIHPTFLFVYSLHYDATSDANDFFRISSPDAALLRSLPLFHLKPAP